MTFVLFFARKKLETLPIAKFPMMARTRMKTMAAGSSGVIQHCAGVRTGEEGGMEAVKFSEGSLVFWHAKLFHQHHHYVIHISVRGSRDDEIIQWLKKMIRIIVRQEHPRLQPQLPRAHQRRPIR
jgi:hypothetical protein